MQEALDQQKALLALRSHGFPRCLASGKHAQVAIECCWTAAGPTGWSDRGGLMPPQVFQNYGANVGRSRPRPERPKLYQPPISSSNGTSCPAWWPFITTIALPDRDGSLRRAGAGGGAPSDQLLVSPLDPRLLMVLEGGAGRGHRRVVQGPAHPPWPQPGAMACLSRDRCPCSSRAWSSMASPWPGVRTLHFIASPKTSSRPFSGGSPSWRRAVMLSGYVAPIENNAPVLPMGGHLRPTELISSRS